jgi:hypothetical protein
MPSVDEELLTADGMAAAHATLVARYPWFLHIKPVLRFEEIKRDGLTPRRQGFATNKTVAAALSDSVANID